MTDRDAFELRYTAGVLDEDPEPAAPLAAGRDFLAEAMPTESVALHGCVLTANAVHEKGYVVVEQASIADITTLSAR
jgi:hypothetical protein